MTKTQLEALAALAEGPRRLHAGTGSALVRRGYADARGGRYEITDGGRRLLERTERTKVEARQSGELDEKARKRVERAMGWIEFCGEGLSSWGLRYARTAAGALVLGQEPPPSGFGWSAEDEERIRRHAEVALMIVDDLDRVRSRSAGGEMAITFEAVAPRSPVEETAHVRSALDAASSEGIVDLTTYRERRA